MEGNFNVHESDIPGVAIGCYRAGKKVSCEDKTNRELKGVTRNQKNRNQHYLTAPVLAHLHQEMMNKRLAFLSSQSKYHELSTHYVHQQGIGILKLFHVLKSHELRLENKQYHHIKSLEKYFHKRHQNKLFTVRRMETKFTMKL